MSTTFARLVVGNHCLSQTRARLAAVPVGTTVPNVKKEEVRIYANKDIVVAGQTLTLQSPQIRINGLRQQVITLTDDYTIGASTNPLGATTVTGTTESGATYYVPNTVDDAEAFAVTINVHSTGLYFKFINIPGASLTIKFPDEAIHAFRYRKVATDGTISTGEDGTILLDSASSIATVTCLGMEGEGLQAHYVWFADIHL